LFPVSHRPNLSLHKTIVTHSGKFFALTIASRLRWRADWRWPLGR
jgi:hypothetical protein